jgi:hypothetical protein
MKGFMDKILSFFANFCGSFKEEIEDMAKDTEQAVMQIGQEIANGEFQHKHELSLAGLMHEIKELEST